MATYDPNFGPWDWVDKYKRLAAVLLGIDPGRIGGWWTDFATTAAAGSWTSAVAGTGAATALTTLGGRVQQSTGATAGSNVRTINSALTVQPNIEKFLVYARLRVVTASGANTDNRLVTVNASLANDYAALRLTNGVLNLELAKGGAKTTVATTWTPETVNYHDFAISSDLTTVRAFVDGVEVGNTSTLTNLSDQACNFESNVQNGATAADQQTIIDKAALYTGAP